MVMQAPGVWGLAPRRKPAKLSGRICKRVWILHDHVSGVRACLRCCMKSSHNCLCKHAPFLLLKAQLLRVHAQQQLI